MCNCTNSNTLHGSASNIQIQQNTNNSTQSMNFVETLDFENAAYILSQLRANMEGFGLSDNDQHKLKNIISEITPKIDAKKDSAFIKSAFIIIKDMLVGVSGSLAASGILHLISQL